MLLGLTTALRASPAEKQSALAALDAVGLAGFGTVSYTHLTLPTILLV